MICTEWVFAFFFKDQTEISNSSKLNRLRNPTGMRQTSWLCKRSREIEPDNNGTNPAGGQRGTCIRDHRISSRHLREVCTYCQAFEVDSRGVGSALENIGWNRTERKSCFPMSLTSPSSSRDRNKYGRKWRRSMKFFKGCSLCYCDAI